MQHRYIILSYAYNAIGKETFFDYYRETQKKPTDSIHTFVQLPNTKWWIGYLDCWKMGLIVFRETSKVANWWLDVLYLEEIGRIM